MQRLAVFLLLALMGLAVFLLYFKPSALIPSRADQVKSSPSNTEQLVTHAPQNTDQITRKDERAAARKADKTSTNPGEVLASDVLEGQVVDLSRQGIANAHITVFPSFNNPNHSKHQSNREGYFSLPRPEQLPLRIQISAPGFESRSLNLPLENSSAETLQTIILQPGGELGVFVIDEEGQPVKNVRIVGTIEQPVFTDAMGYATLTQLKSPATLFLKAKGFNDHSARVSLEEETAKVTLLRNATVMGKVLDATTQQPIPNFSIQMRTHEPSPEKLFFNDDQGRFEMPDLQRKPLSFVVFSPNYLPKAIHIAKPLPKGRSNILQINLEDEGIFLAGQIVDPTGKGIEGAQVTALFGEGRLGTNLPKRTDGQWNIDLNRWLGSKEAITSRDGGFSLGPLPSDQAIHLIAIAPGFAPNTLHQVNMYMADKQQAIQMVLEHQGQISGLAGQEDYPYDRIVTLNDNKQLHQSITLKPGQQSFTFAEVSPGRNTLRFYAAPGEHTLTGEVPGLISDETIVVVQPQTTHEATIGFVDKLTLAGQIFLNGNPMGQAKVVVQQDKRPGRYFQARTDRNGRFEIHPLPKGSYQIMANGSLGDEIYGTRNRERIQLEADLLDLHLEFESMGSVYGRVLDAPPGARVYLEINYPIAENTQARSVKSAVIGHDGSFEVHNVPGGRFNLQLIQIETLPQTLVKNVQMPDDGTDIDLGDLGQAPGTLLVHVDMPEAAPVRFIYLYKRSVNPDTGSRELLLELNPERAPHRISGLELGSFVLEVEGDSFGKRITPRQVPVTISGPQEQTVRFQIVLETTLFVRALPGQADMRFMHAILKNETSQKAITVPFKNQASTDPHNPEPQLFVSENLLFAKGIPQGWWQLSLVNREGMLLERRFKLEKGKPISLAVQESDFSNPEN